MIGCAVLLALAALLLSPLAFVWSVNVLFGLSIAYTFKTWLAALVFLLMVSGLRASSSNE